MRQAPRKRGKFCVLQILSLMLSYETDDVKKIRGCLSKSLCSDSQNGFPSRTTQSKLESSMFVPLRTQFQPLKILHFRCLVIHVFAFLILGK